VDKQKKADERKKTAGPKKSNPALAAAIILIGFGVLAYFVPPIMLTLGRYSLIAAAVFAVLFALGFFAIFWLRARYQRRDRP